MFTDVQTQTLQAVANLSSGVMKMASAYKEKLAALPKPAEPSAIEKCAAALIAHRWVKEAQAEQLATLLKSPDDVLKILTEVATKAAEELDGNLRLENGKAIPGTNAKAAAEKSYVGTREENEHDRNWVTRMNAYKTQMIDN